MKKGNPYLIGLIFFIFGATISYVACQYSFLKIDTEINVIDVATSILGLTIGLYIAITLESKRNRNQNFYSYVEGKFDLLWQDFITLNGLLDYNNSIELKETSKQIKLITQKITTLKKIFEASDVDFKTLIDIENKIDELDDFLSTLSDTNNNILNLDTNRDELTNKLNKANETFASCYKSLNQIS